MCVYVWIFVRIDSSKKYECLRLKQQRIAGIVKYLLVHMLAEFSEFSGWFAYRESHLDKTSHIKKKAKGKKGGVKNGKCIHVVLIRKGCYWNSWI